MECLPLKTFEELDSWSSGDLIDCRVNTVPLANRKGRPKGIPKTLVCHDMCGGYLTDRYNSIMVYYISWKQAAWSFLGLFFFWLLRYQMFFHKYLKKSYRLSPIYTSRIGFLSIIEIFEVCENKKKQKHHGTC